MNHQFLLGNMSAASGIEAVIRSDRPGLLIGRVRNDGPNEATFSVDQSSDNGQTDAYSPLTLRTTEGTQTAIVVVPNGVVEFTVEGFGGSGARASGNIRLTGQPADGNFVIIGDGSGSGLANPTLAPSLATADTGGSLVPGSYTVGYTWTAASGETMLSPTAVIVVPAGTNTNTITATVPALPTGALATKGYFTAPTGTFTVPATTVTTTLLITDQGSAGAAPAGSTSGVKFEFDSNATITAGNVRVAIGATPAATLANLLAAINAHSMRVSATSADETPPSVDLIADDFGTAGNVTITRTGANISVTGLAGGTAGAAPTREGYLRFNAAPRPGSMLTLNLSSSARFDIRGSIGVP